MRAPLQVTYRNLPRSGAVAANILEKAAKLESFYDRILSCRVIIEAPHRHHHKGKAYQVRIDVAVPGGEIVVNRAPKRLDTVKLSETRKAESEMIEKHEPTKHSAHADLYVALRDAFNAAGRKLQDFARRQQGAVKLHESAAQGNVAKINSEERFGFLETPDGREIYFHANSVLPPGFDRLGIGIEVYFSEEQGKKGPQASSVRIAG